jgi:transcriptional regulator with XRE-family HTH domain
MDYTQLRFFLRGKLDLSNRQIALDTGYTANHISGILRGRIPLSERFLNKITETYSITQ